MSRESTQFQNNIAEKLQAYFQEVETEWSIDNNATDVFSNTDEVYVPRLDVAVGPFNVDVGNKLDKIRHVFETKAPSRLKRLIESNVLRENENPRCTLAIEVAYSGSSKHFLGDITNASMMGLYGFVITSNSTFNELKRIFEYVRTVKQVGKTSVDLFSNTHVILDEEFLGLL